MARPIILINSATGSDSCANATIRGTAASTDGAGTLVTLDGSPDLSGVATDGSAWIQLLDATAGARNFSRITAADNSAKTVTVADAFGISLTGITWAINQTLASLSAANSRKLLENNSANGDAMPGWTLRMESAHTESGAPRITFRRAGDTTDGPIVVEGIAGAATRPVVTFNNSGQSFTVSANYITLQGFDYYNTTVNGSTAAHVTSTHFACRSMRIGNSGNTYTTAAVAIVANNATIENCHLQYAVTGILYSGGSGARIRANRIHNCTTGISITTTSSRPSTVITDNIIRSNSGSGISLATTTNSAINEGPITIARNTLHANATDGIVVTCSSAQLLNLVSLDISNNLLTSNGGFGLNFSGASVTDLLLHSVGASVRNNNGGASGTENTSGLCNLTLTLTGRDNILTNPDYASAPTGLTIGAATKALGYPLTGIGLGDDRSFADIGALQREEPSGGGGSALHLGSLGQTGIGSF